MAKVPSIKNPPAAEFPHFAANTPPSTFLAALAHDMGDSLSALKVSIDLLQGLPSREGATFFEILQRQTWRLQQMVQDLKDYQGLASNRIPPLRFQNTDLTCLIKDVVQEFQTWEVSHRLSMELPNRPVYVQVDSGKIKRIVCNLLSNAIKHTRAGSCITIGLVARSENWIIQVEDQGPGVPRSDNRNIFRPFIKLDEGKSGEGLGLYIVRLFAEAHGGKAWLDPSKRDGSRFCVSLPLRRNQN